MDDWKKTKAHLIRELEELRARVAGYESIEQRQKLTQKKQKKKENNTLKNASLVDIMAGSALSLLTCPNISEAVDQALAILGEGANVDRVYLFENHQDPCTGELLASQRFEWSKAGIISQRDNLLLINQPYRNFFPRWQSELPLGRSIKGLIEDFPAAEREFLAAQGILSLLVVPVMIEGRFWGFIGFDDCHEEKEWTKEEESILVAAAGNIVNAIERKRTEEALRKSEDQYRTIFENTGTPLLIFEKDTTICLVNAEFERAFHYARAEVEGRMSWRDITLPEDLEWLKRYHDMRRVDPEASPRNYELRVVDRFGHVQESYITIAMIPGTMRSIASVLDISHLKAAENALRESEAHYRALFEYAGVAIAHVNAQGKFLRANDNFLEFLGYTWKELERINARDVAHPDYIEETRILIEKQINKEINLLFQEKYYVRKDGALRWGEMRSTPIRDEEGKLLSAVVAIIDRTQQKRAEGRLKKYVKQMEDLYENAPFGYHSLGEDGKILRMNDTELSWLGYSRNELIGKRYIDFVVPEGRESWQQLFFLLQNRGRINDIETKLIRKDGTIFPVLLNATALYDEKGKYQMSRSSVLDTTERKRAESALAESEALYRNLFENASIGMFQSTFAGRFLRINKAYAMMLGYELPGEVISTITDTATQIHADPRNRAELLAAVNREGWFYAEQPYLRKNGSIMIGKLAVRKVVKGGDGVSTYLEGIVEDITERKKTEKALQERESELRVKATRLGEANMTLKVLLKTLESDQEEFRERILTNIRDQVLPYLDKLKHSPLNELQRDYVQTAERNLNQIASPFLKKIASGCFNLTMKETQIASLVRDGKTSKEIAGLLNVSQRVVDFHRKNIRKKLGLTERGESLVMLLRSLS